MKFHRVRIENLNSLYGAQTIDFEDDVRNSALFLIIGPTGAGKSTILDAICLALFGQTPRLERRTGKADTDVAHIMSIGTAHAYAEVEFSTLESDGARMRYLASWSARRAYDDPEGAVQRPERSLYRKFDDGTMRLIVSDHREKYYQRGFDEALRGLSVDDFKRSILLAQGEFAAFLHASDGEKASILERLTNTDAYRRIGERASRRRKQVEDRHRTLLTRLDEMQVLTIPQEEDLKRTIEATTARVVNARTTVDVAAKKVDWLQKLEDLEEQQEAAVATVEAATALVEARAEDQGRLNRDAELLEVEPSWRAVERESKAIDETTAALGPLDETLVTLAAAQTQCEAEVERATAALAARQAEREAAEPEIQRAHALRTRRTAAQEELAESRATHTSRLAALEKLTEERTRFVTEHTAAQDRRQAAREHCDAQQERRPLLDRLAPIRAGFEDGIAPLMQREAALVAEMAELDTALAANAKELATFDDEIGAANRERATWQAQVTRALNKAEALLDGHPSVNEAVTKFSAEFAGAATRAEALREARYLLGRIREQEAERNEVHERLQLLEREVAALEAEEAQVKTLEAAHLALVRASEESLRQNERVITLSAFRQDLHGGEPCPLCGSPVHPYCDSAELGELDAQAAADRERLSGELEVARNQLRDCNARVQLLASKFVARKTALRHDESRLVALRTSLEEDQAAFSKSGEKAGYSPLEAFRLKNAGFLEDDLADAQEVVERTRATLEKLEQSRQQIDRAQEKLDGAEGTLAAIDTRTGVLRDAARQIADRRTTRGADLVSTQSDIAARETALLAELRVSGVPLDDEPNIDEALKRAARLRDEIVAADAALVAAEKSVLSSENQLERVGERLAEATTALEAARGEAEKRAAATEQIATEIATCLDGKDPATVKGQLDSALQAAQKSRDDATKVRAENAQQMSAAKARHKELVAQQTTAKSALEAADSKLDAVLSKLGIPRQEVETHLLPAAERKRLRAELDALGKELTKAQARKDDVARRLEAHCRTPLAADSETLTEAVAAHDAAVAMLDSLTLELGALGERWETHEQTRSRRAGLEAELHEVQHDLDVWNTVYGLIGVRDGERFKLFAQSLNLQGLVDKANARLEKLHARYELTVARGDGGEPTLAFMVRDRYQANVERPLTTLSGGETFLVSLALALGLADFRRIDMPIETLLLDEGFGSLDQDSLHMALTTLHQLHRDGSRQIGIISHVDALKELIDARIVVEPRGHGRSTLRFEFGAGQSGQLALVEPR